MSSLKDLLNPASSGPSTPIATPLHSPPASTQKYTQSNTQEEAASTLAFLASSHHHHQISLSHANHEQEGDQSPSNPIAPHHDSSSSDTISSSPIPPVSPRRVDPIRRPTAVIGFTQLLHASSSDRDADGGKEDGAIVADGIKLPFPLDLSLSPSLITPDILCSSPPSASPHQSSTIPTAQETHVQAITIVPATATLIGGKKAKNRRSPKVDPPKRRGVAKPQKKKRKVVVEINLENEIPALAHESISLPAVKHSKPSPPIMSPLSLSPLPKYNAEGMELYCVCRKPDSGKWMIGCDGCEDWFHGECINVAEEDGDLIDKYFCPRCEISGHGITTWKRKCRLLVCRKPAQVDKHPMPSKYCCDDHGIAFFDLKTSSQQSQLSQPELARVADSVPSATDFRRLGYRMPTPPISDENFRDYPEEIERLVSIATEREALKANRLAIEDRGRYVQWSQESAKRIHEQLKADPVARNVGKEICGYDEKLGLGDTEWTTWRNSPEGTLLFHEGRIQGRDGVCIRKKCEKHSHWKSLFIEEAQLQQRLHAERLVQLRQEEKKIKERQKRRSVRDNTEGTVEDAEIYP